MKKKLYLIFIFVIFNNFIYGQSFTEEIAKKTITDGIDRFVIDRSIDKFYEKKFKNIITAIESSQASLKSHLQWLEKNIKKNPKSSKKIFKNKRKLKNIEEALSKAKLISKKSNSLKYAKYIKKFLKEVPVISILTEIGDDVSTQNKVNNLIKKYPSLKSLMSETSFMDDIVSHSFNIAISMFKYGDILKPEKTSYDLYDTFPDPKESRRDFLQWFYDMHSIGKKYKVIGKYVVANGIKTPINDLPAGLKEYFKITSLAIKDKINKVEKDTIHSVVQSNKNYLKLNSKYSSNTEFTDIYRYSRLNKNVKLLVSLNSMHGYADGSFKPLSLLNEQEVITLVINLLLKKEYLLYIKNNKDKTVYDFLDNYFKNYELARIHSWNQDISMTYYKFSELVMKIIYKKTQNLYLLNKNYKNGTMLRYLKNYTAKIDTKKNWDVFSAGLKAFKIYEGNSNGVFCKDCILSRAKIANLLANTYRFILKEKGEKLK